ncbi:hypothetical protein HanIR_Chr13g0657971 [Helianthus annuus]|nr:hypothetical protein HanIR_Chr13g0657971 [Helianthus annuus]
MANFSFYHWSDTSDLKTQFSMWSLKEQRTDQELNRKVDIINDTNYNKTWNSIALLDEVLNSPPSEFQKNAEEFLTQLLEQDKKICNMLTDLKLKREHEITWRKARVYEVLASVIPSV